MGETRQYLERGKEFFNNGQLYEALNEFKKAIEIKPNLADAHYDLGGVYFNLGNLDFALAECNEAISINPNYAEAHARIGGIFVRKGMFDDALLAYLRAIKIDPNSIVGLKELAKEILLDLNDEELNDLKLVLSEIWQVEDVDLKRIDCE